MSVLSYLQKRYPLGKMRATYRILEEKEHLTRSEVIYLRGLSVNGYVDLEHVADIIDHD